MGVDKKMFTLCEFDYDNNFIKKTDETAFMTIDQAKKKNRLFKKSGITMYWIDTKIADQKTTSKIAGQAITQPSPAIPDTPELIKFCDRVIRQAARLSNKGELGEMSTMDVNDLRSLALESAPTLAEHFKKLLLKSEVNSEEKNNNGHNDN